VPSARKLDRPSYDEMIEMAGLGSGIIRIRSVRFAMRCGVPLRARSSLGTQRGTRVVRREDVMERWAVSGVTYSRDEAEIAVRALHDAFVDAGAANPVPER
jgi:aspartate kinase